MGRIGVLMKAVENGLSTITVDTLVDENDGNLATGDISLREALLAVESGGTIVFSDSLARADAGFGQGVIALSLSELVVDKSVTIQGLGADKLTISGNGESRVFRLDDGEASNASEVVITGVTIADGEADIAGGILTAGENLTFIDGVFDGNRGAISTTAVANVAVESSFILSSQDFGINTSGELSLTDSQVVGSEGVGIQHDGSLSLTRSRVSNSADSGIIASDGNNDSFEPNVVLVDSQVDSNTGDGLTLSDDDIVVVLQNSSVTGNANRGIASDDYTSVKLTNSRVESNGADGLSLVGSIRLENSSLANNSGFAVVANSSNIYSSSDISIKDSVIVDNQAGIGTSSYYGDDRITIENSVISGNAASAISGGNVRILQSQIEDNGSGLGGDTISVVDSRISGNDGIGLSGEDITVLRSTISDNLGRGIVVNAERATISDSTISGNIGGGVAGFLGSTNAGRYGYIAPSFISISNSTISSNGSLATFSGGIFNEASPEYYENTVVLENVTIVGNRSSGAAGIINQQSGDYTDSIVRLQNTIVAGNISADANAADVAGEYESRGYNLIGNGTGATGFDETDLVGDGIDPIDPLLSALKDNGGPTLTHSPLFGSLVIDAGVPGSNGDFDQRGSGFVRVLDGDGNRIRRIDIGAVEAPAVPPPMLKRIVGGNREANRLFGTGEAELIRGYGGNDSLNGKGGDDILEGGNGDDKLIGGSGDDRLFGSRGRDLIRGGAGADTFVYKKLNEGEDLLLDFEVGKDLIDLSLIFSQEMYNSTNSFDDYVRLGTAGKRTVVSVLDVTRSTLDNAVFQTLAQLNKVSLTDLTVNSFSL